ncbi:MAG: hypothetical protein J6Q99_03530 [Oscillospiraceae bacterium]|nr:hypothetical protein [Oscillospiraceae bacterium]
MRDKAKRILCLILAFLMISGTLTWLITMVVSAEELLPTVQTGYSLEKVYVGRKNAQNDAFCYERGSPEKTAYTIRGGYYADFDLTVTFSFADESAAAAFAAANGDLKIAIDSGSFTVDKDADSVFEVLSVANSGATVPVQVNIERIRYDGEGNTLGFTLYSGAHRSSHTVAISQCEPYVPSTGSTGSDDNEVDIPSATPYVIVSAYNYGGSNVMAGQEFTLNLTVKNTSSIKVGNMTMTVTTPDAFTLVNSSNTVYIESLGANQTFNHSLQMLTRASANPEPAVVEIAFDYQYVADDTRKDVSRSEKIAIPVSQRDRFEVEELNWPDQLWVGEEYDLEVKYINKGRSTVYNLSAALEGEGLVEANQSENIGNVESGKSGSVDFFLMTEEPGTLTGKIVITYEDVNMNEKTLEYPYSIEVVGMDEPMYEEPMPEYVYNEDGSYYGPDGILYGPDGLPVEEKAGWQVWAVVGGVAAAAAIVAAVVAKKRKAARLLAELEEDNNEDF